MSENKELRYHRADSRVREVSMAGGKTGRHTENDCICVYI